MAHQMWRCLKPDGIFFCRLASLMGITDGFQPLGGRWYLLPDGTERFLVDEAFLMKTTSALDATLYEPVKTVVVHGQRNMTNWFLKKKSG